MIKGVHTARSDDDKDDMTYSAETTRISASATSTGDAMNYTFQPCEYQDVEATVIAHNTGLISPIDSFAEEHILQAMHYTIACRDSIIGYCSIYKGNVLTQFYLKDTYRHLSQDIFAHAKKLESVNEALVATCDELFLSLSVDCCSAIKKQAYFFQYVRDIDVHVTISPRYRRASLDDMTLIQHHSEDFFDDALEKQIIAREIYIGLDQQTPIAFGVFERGKILRNHVSIGMYTAPKYRRMHIGKMTLKYLINEALNAELQPIAGCSYYNHVSQKTLEGVGMISNTRYLRIAF
ncbi:GNAT family N-acetyltransferase [Candidatus Hydrogenedentota bacterium]